MTSVTLAKVSSVDQWEQIEEKQEVEKLKPSILNIISGNFAVKEMLHRVERKIIESDNMLFRLKENYIEWRPPGESDKKKRLKERVDIIKFPK